MPFYDYSGWRWGGARRLALLSSAVSDDVAISWSPPRSPPTTTLPPLPVSCSIVELQSVAPPRALRVDVFVFACVTQMHTETHCDKEYFTRRDNKGFPTLEPLEGGRSRGHRSFRIP
ncbi:hypothetical protein J6590_006098 [Homalodisca vitripennis]|nr:hypothetical protein J6590_006098 [Homalodisca vitripennis]